MAAWSKKERGYERKVKSKEESKKKGAKGERRVKEEIEAQEEEWTERKGNESALSAVHQERYKIFSHVTMKTKEIGTTPWTWS